ncbi:MAG: dihydroorotate dehydrogenase [Deltaproteobacteria bacterium]|nr:MAG: dihydroorotate dehydrogenase [Deltaproteobacteria bacterium]
MLESGINLEVDLGFVKLKNPVIAASGTFGYGDEIAEHVDVSRLGGFVTKGLSIRPREGNPPPRICETPCGILNSIGLENIGIERFITDKLPRIKDLNTAIIVNIFGEGLEEYARAAEMLKGIKEIAAIEINISCPNVKKGGILFGTDPKLSAQVTEAVLKNSDKPVIVKLSPNVTDITVIAKAVEKAGAHAISLINTLRGMAIDIEGRRPVLGNIQGGLSGPAIKPVALYLTYQVVQNVNIPVIGGGGIVDYKDALEFLIVGARAVQVGTANLIDPRTTHQIIDGIKNYCLKSSISDIQEIIGSLITDLTQKYT